jgi:DNA-binding transcriptional ArsR family regulator
LKGVCIGDIQQRAGLSQSTISKYMGLLKEACLVNSSRHGKWTCFRRDKKAIQEFISSFRTTI